MVWKKLNIQTGASEDEDEYDYENEIFPMLSSVRMQTNVILAGKLGEPLSVDYEF